MNLAMAVEEIIRAHPLGIARRHIEAQLRESLIKGGSRANVKRILAQLLAQNLIAAHGNSVSRIYIHSSANLKTSPAISTTTTEVYVSTVLLEEVKQTAKSIGMSDAQGVGTLIDTVLRNWIAINGIESNFKLPGHVERVEWVLDHLKGNAAEGCVGPIGAKQLAKEFAEAYPVRKLSVSFISSALKELVAVGKLQIVSHRSGPVGCIYQVS